MRRYQDRSRVMGLHDLVEGIISRHQPMCGMATTDFKGFLVPRMKTYKPQKAYVSFRKGHKKCRPQKVGDIS